MNLQSALSEDWKSYNLSEIITLIGGGTPKTTNTEYWGGDIPWLSVKDFNNDFRYVYTTEKTITQLGLEQSSTTLLQKDDIIISARGTVGETAMIPYPMAFNQSCYGIRAKRDFVDSIFLYYLLKNSIKNLKNNAHGSVFDTITRETFDGISIDLPPLPTQKKIAAILSSLDDKIELNTRMNNVLEEIARALFNQWFVEFEFPNAEGKPYKSAGGKMVESEMGSVPEGWRVFKISQIIDVKDGTHDSPKAVECGLHLVTSKHLEDYGVNIRDAYQISKEDYIKINQRSRVEPNDILISMIGTVGNISYIMHDEVNFAIKNVGLFKTSKKQILTEYVYLHLKSDCITNYIQTSLAGSTQQYISLKGLRNIPINLPTEECLSQFKLVISSIFERIKCNSNQNDILINLRDALLPKLMSGEIEV